MGAKARSNSNRIPIINGITIMKNRLKGVHVLLNRRIIVTTIVIGATIKSGVHFIFFIFIYLLFFNIISPCGLCLIIDLKEVLGTIGRTFSCVTL